MDRLIVTEGHPFYDPDNVDPDHRHLRGIMDRLKYDPNLGAVCSVYELCGHEVCKASYALWAAVELTKEVLGKIDAKRFPPLSKSQEYVWCDYHGEIHGGTPDWYDCQEHDCKPANWRAVWVEGDEL